MGYLVDMDNIKGLDTVVKYSKDIPKRRPLNEHLEILFDLSLGEVWGEFHIKRARSECDDKDVITCGNVYHEVTKHEIKELILESIFYQKDNDMDIEIINYK